MTVQMNIAAAKARLSELVARAEAGETVVIARDGKPVVTLTPATRPGAAKRPLGVWDRHGDQISADTLRGPDVETASALEIWDTSPLFPS